MSGTHYNPWRDIAYDDENSYLESDDFANYAAMVEIIVHGSETPVGTRQIHLVLGERTRREWTLDALESLRSVEKIEGLIDRWRQKDGMPPIHRKKWSGDSMSFLFGRGKLGRDTEIAETDFAEART